jgi:riboflavin synthase
MRYIVSKGYVTLDGTSLTVVDVGQDWFNVTLVAYTQAHIVMPLRKVGEHVNIEVDVLGKYVERLLQYGIPGAHASHDSPGTALADNNPTITHEFLKENGYD